MTGESSFKISIESVLVALGMLGSLLIVPWVLAEKIANAEGSVKTLAAEVAHNAEAIDEIKGDMASDKTDVINRIDGLKSDIEQRLQESRERDLRMEANLNQLVQQLIQK